MLRLVPLLVALLFWSFNIEALQAQSPETLTGSVINGTQGGAVPDGLEITLNYLNSTGDAVATRADVFQGKFIFRGIPNRVSSAYQLTVQYKGIDYSLEVSGSQTAHPLLITVYETAGDVSVFSILDGTLVITPGEKAGDALEVLAVMQLENRSDRTFVTSLERGNPMNLLRFSLPANAYDLSVQAFLEGGHIVQVDRGFALTAPVPPGKHDLLFAYHAPYEGGNWAFQQNFPFGAEVFRVMVAEGLGTLSAPLLKEQDTVKVGSIRYQVLHARDIVRGDRVSLDLGDLPRPPAWQRLNETLSKGTHQRSALLILVTFGLLILLGLALFRRRAIISIASPNLNMASKAITDDRMKILRAIAHLDQVRDNGGIQEERYRNSRKDLMDRLEESES